jgi:signal transduction histidine kinase
VFGELDLQKTFEAAVDGIRRLMGARSCSIFLWDDALETFVLRATRGIDQKWVGKANYKPAEGLTGWIGQHGRPLNLRNRTKAELARIHPDLRWGKKYTDPKHADEQAPLLGVPIFLSGRSAGVIWMSDRPSRGPFTEFDQQMLTAVASHLASAIVYGQRTDGRQLVLRTVGQLIQSLEARVNAFKGGGSLTAPRASSIITSALDEVRQQLKADTVTLYPFLPKLQLFRTPPFSAGLIKHPKLMEHAIHSHDAPWQVMKKSPRFWKSVATHRAISGRRPAQSDQPERQRFAVREAVASAAAVRLDIEGEPVGVLFVNYGSPQSFLTPQRELIKTLAGHLALAVALASLYRQMRALTSLEERDFLGQDLHDGALAAVDVAVDFADHARHALGQGDREAAAQHLTVAMGAANHASSELRDLISMFKKSLIDELGLVGALRQLNELWRLEGLQVSLKTRDVPVPPRFARHLFRISQCAVHNARSGGARQVTVTIEPTAKSIFLSIADNGTGFVVEEADKPFHFGVRGMRRRALRLGGTAEIASTLGVGTVVNVTVPLDGGVYDKES